ncbi:hypothetical protein [Lacibacter sp. MH-610]
MYCLTVLVVICKMEPVTWPMLINVQN